MTEITVESALENEAAAREAEKDAKNALREAKSAATAAEKDAKGKEGAEGKAATTVTAKAKKAVTTAEKDVADKTAARQKATEAVKTAKAKAREAKVAEREADKVRKAEERANRKPLAKLTNSQRRAVCALADAGKKGVVPTTDMARTPFNYLVEVGYAEKTGAPSGESKYLITDAGKERAATIDISKYALPSKKEKVAS